MRCASVEMVTTWQQEELIKWSRSGQCRKVSTYIHVHVLTFIHCVYTLCSVTRVLVVQIHRFSDFLKAYKGALSDMLKSQIWNGP